MIYFYSIEIIFRFIHLVSSFILCSIVIVNNANWLLLFLTYPFLKPFDKNFIATHVTDLFDVIWVLVYSISLLFILPLFSYQVLAFFKSSWYRYQVKILKNSFYWTHFSVVFTFGFCYTVIMPVVLNFLIRWENLEQTKLILVIEAEFRILSFIHWVLNFHFTFIFLVFFYLMIMMLIWLLFKIDKIYFLIKHYRKQLTFISLVFLFILSPSDISLQFFLMFFTILFYEFVFFFVCYKIANSN